MDEVDKCKKIVEDELKKGNLKIARKFAEKAQRIKPTKGIEVLLEQIRLKEISQNMKANTERNYTDKQKNHVDKVLAATCPYQILGLSKNCTESDIRKAYKEKVLLLHPDRNGAPKAVDAIKKVNSAYDILNDPQKKAYYDSTGNTSPNTSSNVNFNTGDIFDELFKTFATAQGTTFYYTNFGRQRGNTQSNQRNISNGFGLLQLLFIIFLAWQIFGSLFQSTSNYDSMYGLTPTNIRTFSQRTYEHNIPFYVTKDFNLKYPPNSYKRAEVEAEIEYLIFRNQCERNLAEYYRNRMNYKYTNQRSKVIEIDKIIDNIKQSNTDCVYANAIKKKFYNVTYKLEKNLVPLSAYKEGW